MRFRHRLLWGMLAAVLAGTAVIGLSSSRLLRDVRLAVGASQIREVVSDFVWTVSGLALVVLLALALLAYAGLRRLSRPAERIAELHGEHALLGSVVSDMKEGLLTVGPDRRIRMANRAAREIFDLAFEPVGRRLAEVVRHPEVMPVIETALDEQAERRERIVELPGSGRSFELHVTPLGRDQGVVALLFDVTRIEALERVRREFVANVSHELRTPLTSIKAFVETLVSGGLKDRENSLRFLRIINKHTDRMEALINDITDLSQIETGAVRLDLDPVDASRVVNDVEDNLAPAIEQYGVQVRIDLPVPFHVRVDRRRFEQVLTNLIDNAIKFNRPGGTVLIVGGEHEGRRQLVVEDTGIGIPSDSLERIFRRFYRVDPARSREAGGTGLGLAIVKHLMRLHGGRVRVESELGVGSRFVLEFAREESRESAPTPSSETASG